MPNRAAEEAQETQLRRLFDAARGGDRVALDELCRAARPRLYRAAYAIVRDGDEADDVAQEALVRALKRRFTFLGTGSVTGWLLRITVNLAKNRRRDAARRRELLEERGAELRGDGPRAPEQALVDGEGARAARARAEQALAALSPRQRDVVALRLAGELSFAEVAGALRIREENARVTFSQAKKKLAHLLQEEPT